MKFLEHRQTALAALVLGLVLANPAAGQHHGHHDDRALEDDPRLAEGQIAPVLEGLGDHHHPVTTNSKRAQLFFDQGLKLTYGFNHKEALRSFKEAARLDPDCAMAYWGWALVLGPNLNLPMRATVVDQAYEAVQMAVERRDKVSEKERAYIDALALRYTDDLDAERKPFDEAYAKAMGELHKRYPEDNDAATLYAAALMNLSPWNYWTPDAQPRENTEELLAVLEGVMERDPKHEGALHYYIHAVEPVDAERGVQAADTLTGLAPGAGHLVHMPSHIYMQVGRYGDAFDANAAAVEADEDYITQCAAQGIYPLNYYPHNLHFLVWASLMRGRSQDALDAARKVASNVPEDMEGNVWGLFETLLTMPIATMVRFGRFEELLNEPEPPIELLEISVLWRYGRGLAYVDQGKIRRAKRELAALRKMSGDPARYRGGHPDTTISRIAHEVLAGEIAAKRGDYEQAILHLSRAVRLEDGLPYSEPPMWYYPVRHTLGAVLLESGASKEAETVYWEDLEKHKDNGYSLFGLWKSLQAQGRNDEADEVEQRFRDAWVDADVQLTSSRF